MSKLVRPRSSSSCALAKWYDLTVPAVITGSSVATVRLNALEFGSIIRIMVCIGCAHQWRVSLNSFPFCKANRRDQLAVGVIATPESTKSFFSSFFALFLFLFVWTLSHLTASASASHLLCIVMFFFLYKPVLLLLNRIIRTFALICSASWKRKGTFDIHRVSKSNFALGSVGPALPRALPAGHTKRWVRLVWNNHPQHLLSLVLRTAASMVPAWCQKY